MAEKKEIILLTIYFQIPYNTYNSVYKHTYIVLMNFPHLGCQHSFEKPHTI